VLRTVELFLLSFPLDVFIALVIGIARLSNLAPLRATAACFVEFFRGTSLYVQLFWIFFALPFLGIRLTVWQAAVIGLALNHGAYASECVRGSILAVPKGQAEAAIALSFTPVQRLRYVVLPQALVIMLPLLTNEAIMLLKNTSIVSLITLKELTYNGQAIIARTYQPVVVLTAVLFMYFIMNLGIARVARVLEARLGSWRPLRG
jgi:polar amino acid transport system permease protein